VSVYLKLACYNVIGHKTLSIISWCHSVLVNIFVSYVVFDCTCNTQEFFVIEPTQRVWHTSKKDLFLSFLNSLNLKLVVPGGCAV